MTRLIDADKFIETARSKLDMQDLYLPADIKEFVLDKMPTIDAGPVKHGKWIDHDDEGYVECPFCGCCTNSDGNIKELHYCFNCGAMMD